MADAIDATEARRQLLARMLSGQAGAASAAVPEQIPVRNPERPVPLTSEQSQLWLHAQMAPDMPLYNESITIHRLGPYDHSALEKAMSEIIRRHAIWRTAFVEENGDLIQKIAPAKPISLRIIDISRLPADQRDAEAVRLATEDARTPIPIDQAPLFRARVVKLGEEDHRLYLTLHHIIFDGVSIYRTLVPELAALVAAYEKSKPSPLPEPALQYADYAVWQTDNADPAAMAGQIEYWRGTLAEPLPRLEFAGDRPRPAIPDYSGSMEVFALPEALIEQLKELAKAEGATLYIVLLAAFKALLFRYTGETDIIVGGVTDTRRRPELQPLIGYFLNTMALRSQPRPEAPFRQYLANVKASVIGALGAIDVPFDRLIRTLNIKRGSGTHPLFNILFSIEPPVEPFPAGWDLTQMDVVVGAAKYDVYLELDERPDGFAGRFLYSTELFDPPTIRRMICHWQRMLEAIAADPATPLANLPMLPDEEQRMLAVDWNDTARALPHDNLVDWLTSAAERAPERIVIEQGSEHWTYADLSRHSDAIAARLRVEGIGPDMLVGISLERTPWMIAAMLGVAKAGAAYLPLDPGFPPARLALIAESAKPALILVEDATRSAVPDDAAPRLMLDRGWQVPQFQRQPIDGEDLAYVLYTSGSTGVPKGVEVYHAALVNLLAAMQEAPGFGEGESLLALTTLSFDIAALEIWLPLVSGGRIILASREEASDMAALTTLIEATKPDVMQATPATWRGLVAAGWRGDGRLRALCGGEALPRPLADQLLRRVGALWNMYGPTETTIWSTTAQVEPGNAPVSIGRPIANTEVRVLDRAGNDLPVGAVGELHIGGRGLARGYRGRPDLTAERFINHRGKRFYRTGDLARWRPDGTLECLGRTDNEEKIRGFRIAIEEIEAAMEKLEGISAAAVRAWPDSTGERMLAGYVVPDSDVPPSAGALRSALAGTLPDYMIPSRFEILEALPMTPNGKVDRRALPEPGASVIARAFEPPANETERRLALIWGELLKIDRIGRTDSFLDLGGHSLLVARLLRRIEDAWGLRIGMAEFFRDSRLAELAARLDAPETGPVSDLIPIQPQGSRLPIVWIDGGPAMLPLARSLGEDQPFFGLSLDIILERVGTKGMTLEKVANEVVAALRAAAPEGPYLIGGWCTVGILSFEVARQLRAAGEYVPLLILGHSINPVQFNAIGKNRMLASKARHHAAMWWRLPASERLPYAFARARGVLEELGMAEPELRSGTYYQHRDALEIAAYAYQPGSYKGDVAVFQPIDRLDVLDTRPGWSTVVRGKLSVHDIPGDHGTMRNPPNVATFAARLSDELSQIERVHAEAPGLHKVANHGASAR